MANPPTLLALDLGSTTGWAVRTIEPLIQSGTASFRPGRFEGGDMAFLRFKRWLEDMQETLGAIDLVYFEEVRSHRGTIAAHVYGGFGRAVSAGIEFEKSQLQIQQLLRTTGGTSGKTAEDIEALAISIGKTTLASRQEVRLAAADLLTFRAVAGETFDRTLGLAQDLASLGFGSAQDDVISCGTVEH